MFNLLQNLSFQQAGIGSSLFQAYVDKKIPNPSWIKGYPDDIDFEKAAKERLKGFPQQSRQILVEALTQQYKTANVPDESVEFNLRQLALPNTLTITTGHQLGFGGAPLFLLYKIASLVSLAKRLNQQFPTLKVVPVFWMNSDDHDLDEVKSFFWQGQSWTLPLEGNNGPVGDYLCPDMPIFWDNLKQVMPQGNAWIDAFQELKQAYQPGIPLGLAFRTLIAQWTKGEGLICLDQQDPVLKKHAWQDLSNLLEENLWHDAFLKTTQEQELAGFKAQVNPMPSMFFFHSSAGRERIEKVGQHFVSNHSKFTWNTYELKAHMNREPQLFSTNVTGRSLYQETILPNMVYIGGAAELRYWMQFSGMFQTLNRPFPILIPRESFLFLGQKEWRYLNQIKVEIQDVIGKKEKGISHWVHQHLDNFPDQPWNAVLDAESMKWAKAFAEGDATLHKAVLARYAGLKKELNVLNTKRLKAVKQKEMKAVLRLEHLFDWIQPNGIFQERIQHPWLLGPDVKQLFQELLIHSNPLHNQVLVMGF